MAKHRARGKTVPMVWERGYRCHTLWQGDNRVGRISLGEHGCWDGLYRCEAGTVNTELEDLGKAKSWVERAVRIDMVQRRLF